MENMDTNLILNSVYPLKDLGDVYMTQVQITKHKTSDNGFVKKKNKSDRFINAIIKSKNFTFSFRKIFE